MGGGTPFHSLFVCSQLTTETWTPIYRDRLRLKCDRTRAETRFPLSAKRTSPFKSAGASVQSTTGSRGVRISGSNAGHTMFRASMKSTGYPLHSPVSPSLPLPASPCSITFQLDSMYKERNGCPVTCQAGIEGGTGIALPIIDLGLRRERVASATGRPLYRQERDQVPIGQEAGWVREISSASRFESPDRPGRTESLYQHWQGWRTFLRTYTQTVYKFRRNSFAWPWRFRKANNVLEYSTIFINRCTISNVYYRYTIIYFLKRPPRGMW
jgi:hypothetical protein